MSPGCHGVGHQGQDRLARRQISRLPAGTRLIFGDDDQPHWQRGLTGPAKVYGMEVSLFYYLMRRPIAALRRLFGL